MPYRADRLVWRDDDRIDALLRRTEVPGSELAQGRRTRRGPAVPAGRTVRDVQNPFTAPQTSVGDASKIGPQLGSFTMAERLDIQRDMIVKQLGSQTWEMGVAGDKEFKILFFTFRKPARATS